MTWYIYQLYDEELEAFTLTNIIDATKEQMEYSCKTASIKKPETLIGKDHCVLYLVGEVKAENGEIIVYPSRQLVFDYKQAVAYNLAKQQALAKEVTENVGKES